jgi:TPR repeat protein
MPKLSGVQIEHLWAAAQRGDLPAQYALGGAYYSGNGVSKDAQQGAHWLLKAAEAGYGPAQCDLGVMYQNGAGVDQSYSDALKWYLKAAEHRDPLACHNLGSLYAKGFKDKRMGFVMRMRFARATSDFIEAYKWFLLAARWGHKLSEKDLLRLARFMTVAQIKRAKWLAQDYEQDVQR